MRVLMHGVLFKFHLYNSGSNVIPNVSLWYIPCIGLLTLLFNDSMYRITYLMALKGYLFKSSWTIVHSMGSWWLILGEGDYSNLWSREILEVYIVYWILGFCNGLLVLKITFLCIDFAQYIHLKDLKYYIYR